MPGGMPVVLATGSFDHKIRFWKATSGTCPKMLRFEESQVNCIAISADKSLLVAGGNPVIHLYEINSTQDAPLLSFEGHTSNVMTVGFQKDRKWMFSCSEDCSIRIWDLRSAICERRFDCAAACNTAALHPNQVSLFNLFLAVTISKMVSTCRCFSTF